MKKIVVLCACFLPLWVLAQDPLQKGGEIERNFEVVEQSAQPQEGYKAFMADIQKRLLVPENAQKQQISGTVYLQFWVNEEGNFTQLEVLRGIGGGWDEEVLRVFKEYDKKWQPSKQQGKAVKQQIVMKVECKLK